jgi:hypothetical protein
MIKIFLRQHSQPIRNAEKVRRFGGGAKRDVYKILILTRGSPRATFDDIACGGNCGASELCLQSKPFLGGQAPRRMIDSQNQVVGHLKYSQFSMIAAHVASPTATTVPA